MEQAHCTFPIVTKGLESCFVYRILMVNSLRWVFGRMISFMDLLHTTLVKEELMKRSGRRTIKYPRRGESDLLFCLPMKCTNVHLCLCIFYLQKYDMCQKPVKKITKTELKKNIKATKINTDVKYVAGPKEDLAIKALHRMFIKKLAKTSNLLAFQVQNRHLFERCKF